MATDPSTENVQHVVLGATATKARTLDEIAADIRVLENAGKNLPALRKELADRMAELFPGQVLVTKRARKAGAK